MYQLIYCPDECHTAISDTLKYCRRFDEIIFDILIIFFIFRVPSRNDKIMIGEMKRNDDSINVFVSELISLI